MPRLKQPPALQSAAMNVLVSFLANYCDQLSSDDNGKLRRVVSAIKSEICRHIPGLLAAEFYEKFFEEYENLHELRVHYRPDVNQRAVLELIMDTNITGLRCEGAIMQCLDPNDAYRFRGLRLLELCYRYHLPINLINFNLQDLTTLVFSGNATDADLEVIGKNCPKLVFVDVRVSKAVTNRGLRHLNLCRELRFVDVSYCRISYTGITQLLSANTKVEEIKAWPNSSNAGFDCFPNSDSSIYPTIRSFAIVLDRVSNEDLRTVVEKFPNLISFKISGHLAGDLCVLKSLSKLARLDFSRTTGCGWDNLKGLLAFSGGKITELRTYCTSDFTSCVNQSDLNYLFEFCGGIQTLEFDYQPRSGGDELEGDELEIPPFENLTSLSCGIPPECRRRKTTLKFGQMSELEDLTIDGFYITAIQIEWMILYSPNFPKLKKFTFLGFSEWYNDVDAINQIAKKNNLDLEIIAGLP